MKFHEGLNLVLFIAINGIFSYIFISNGDKIQPEVRNLLICLYSLVILKGFEK